MDALPIRRAAVALLCGLSAPALATNFLVVVVDDLGTDKLASYLSAEEEAQAYFLPETPTLDEVATAGLRFTRAWSNPICSPSRASFLTGDYPSTHGLGGNVAAETGSAELADGPSLAGDLAAAGWATAAFGKWHLGYTGVGGTVDWDPSTTCPDPTPIADELNPLRHGFDAYVGELSKDVDSYVDWWQGASPGDGTTATCAATEYHDEVIVEAALDWIAERWDPETGTMEPWFATVALKAAHSDGDGAGTVYEENDLPPSLGITEPCLVDRLDHSCGDADGDGQDDEERMVFAALVEGVDASLTALLEGVAAIGDGALDDTLVVVWGDNGTTREVMEPPFTSTSAYGKGTMYETGIRVPLLVADGATWRAVHEGRTPPAGLIRRPGRAVSRSTLIADLPDTLMEVAGGASSHPTDGESFTSCFTTTTAACGAAPLRPMWSEQFAYDGATVRSAEGAWRSGTTKMHVRYQRSGACLSPSVYELGTDPYEATELYATLPATRARALKRQVAAVGAVWFPHTTAGQVAWCR